MPVLSLAGEPRRCVDMRGVEGGFRRFFRASGIGFYGSVVGRVTSFDIDLRRAFAAGGSAGAAIQIARACFGCDVATTATAADLLDELRRPEVHAIIEWRQDRLFLTPQVVGTDMAIIASENQACWQAAQRPGESVEIGNVSSAGWTTWGSMDLGEFLLRLLAMEVVVGHGPCVVSDDVPPRALRPFELLPPVVFPDESATSYGVVATDRWFGVFVGDNENASLYAAPAERVQHDLAAVAPGVSWMGL